MGSSGGSDEIARSAPAARAAPGAPPRLDQRQGRRERHEQAGRHEQQEGRHAGSRPVSTQAGGVHATPECTSAVARANTTIAWAVKMGRAFVQQTQVVNQLARGQTTVAAAVRDDQAPSAEGMAAVSRFNDALADYLRVV